MIEADYAKALYALGDKASMPAFLVTLKRHRHQKLLSKIFSEYQKLILQGQRLAMHKKVTPEQEQTRVLLELYRKLTHV